MTVHKSVLLEEAINNLNLEKGKIVVDATLGGGGHSLEILKKILPGGKLVVIDRDIEAIENFRNKIKNDNDNDNDNELIIEIGKDLILINSNFSDISRILENEEIEKVDAILADFGLSSDQLADKERGFSFLQEGKLDMRMSTGNTNDKDNLTAEDVVNDYSQEDLLRILRKYGEEKFAKRIVEKIIIERDKRKIKTTTELVNIILEVVPERYKRKKIHPATKTFQALRIEVNEELKSIEKFIEDAVQKLKIGGRLVVISFHSGEDRIVKNIFKNLKTKCICPPEFPICKCGKKAKIKIISRKLIIANDEEILKNPRSRSAKMRVVEKI
ncbi:MAG TPA: 16S rRNA (cytosine(1402)-N(4))-methyltransferase RsmH [Candidatus Moranbacteria bacterium]|nr:16S rRNA (cytosine(1402)-N(4))-methyltransferase RsmH [Candidatus Moranbacteria bacterium]